MTSTTNKTIFPLLVLITSTLSNCQSPPHEQQPTVLSGNTMGTTYTVKINSDDAEIQKNTLLTAINQRLDDINQQMSTYIDTSSISLFNQAMTTDWIDIPLETYTVIKEALRIHQLSHHSFDITISPLVNLWGFGTQPQKNIIPHQTAIQKALDNIGSEHINIRSNPYAIKKNKAQISIDLSAIAKGFAVDLIADLLDEMKFTNYLVEIGGEIKSKGINPNGDIWHIGIEQPINDQRSVQISINLNNMGMATSGDYRNYFEKNGTRYSHTIDPTTGKPITHNLASVTVLHPSTMTADAMATALLVLGLEDGLKLAHQENLAVLFIIRHNDTYIEKMTAQFRQHLTPPPKTKTNTPNK